MGYLKAILEIFAKFLGWGEAKEKNLPTRELKNLDEEAAKLRTEIDAAFNAGNTVELSELQEKLDACYRRSETLRAAGSNAGGKGN